MSEQIHRVAVWPPLLRVLHLMMAATTIILTVTGALLGSGMILNDQLYQHLLQVWHLPAGNVLLLVLLVRLFLLVTRSDVTGWRALLPERFDSVIATATFYLSLARMNLPGYYAHNPLWQPIYLVWILLLAVQGWSGLLLQSAWLRSVVRTDSAAMLEQHAALTGLLGFLLVAHVVTALLHDWKSGNSDNSAMISGYKTFTVENTSQSKPLDQSINQQVGVSLDSLLGSKKSAGKNSTDKPDS